MPDSRIKLVVAAVAASARTLGLTDGPTPLPFVERDRAVVEKDDDLPLCLVSCADEKQTGQMMDAQREVRLYPVQLSLVAPSNRSFDTGRGLQALYKEALWTHFQRQQPRALDALPLLWKQEVQAAMPMDSTAWRNLYSVQFLFVMVQLGVEL